MTDTNARPASENFGTEKTQRSNSIALDEDPENQDLDPTKRFPPFEEDPYLVFLDEEESPRNYSLLRKCVVVFVVSTGALCSTFASSIAAFAETGVEQTFHVSREVAILSVSLYVLGIAFGPLFAGPMSEVYGRSPVYQISYVLFWIFSWPVAFAPHISVLLIFRFITGICSSAFLSVAGGSVSDMFAGHQVAIPTALYTLAPFLGPMLGPLISGFINQNTTWRWTYRLLLIWVFIEVLLIFFLVPETYEPRLRQSKAKKLRQSTGESKFYAPLDRREGTLFRKICVSCYRPFELLLFDTMCLLLNLWTSMIFGILYLAFQAFPYIFIGNHGFDVQSTGLAFVGLGIGMIMGTATNIALIVYTHKQYPGVEPPPEARLLTGEVGAVVVPLSLYWLAFTSYSHVHWIGPIIASAFFGAGLILCFSSTFTYLVSAYRPIAASAMAANAFARSSFGAAFPLFAGQMYSALGTDGATALLAGIMTIAVPLPFIFRTIGARHRAKSRFAAH